MVTKKSSRSNSAGGGSEGPATDSQNVPVIDPTPNVRALSEADNLRQDDLREAAAALTKCQYDCLKEIIDLRDEHRKELAALQQLHDIERQEAKQVWRASEAQRIDENRGADVKAARIDGDRLRSTIQNLADRMDNNINALRTTLVSTTASVESQLATRIKAESDRVTALERSSWQDVGRQRIADPQMEALLAEVKLLRESGKYGLGKDAGIGISWGALVGAGGIVVAMIMGFQFLSAFSHQPVPAPVAVAPAPQVIYVPAPAGALIPSTPAGVK